MKDKLSNIQKESEKVKLKKDINKLEDLKAQALLNLGIMAFDKIRKSEIVNKDFNEICEEIKNYDIEIYTKYMQIRGFEEKSNKITCDCGYEANNDEKFCSQCGKNLRNEKQYITCVNCNQKIEKDSIFCPCCGNKVNEDNHDDIYILEENSKVNIIENDRESSKEIKEESILEAKFIEKDGREFLTVHEYKNME
ncbi:zinc ribbon domain-containing protein [Terrisporobacter sp.]